MKVGVLVRAGAPLFAAAFLAVPTHTAARTVLVFGPHPDDEMLIAAGRARAGVEAGDTVKLIVVTNGDFNAEPLSQELGLLRQAESVAAAEALGLTEQDVIFLGYPDGGMIDLYARTTGSVPYVSAVGFSETYGARGLGGMDYHRYRHPPAGAPYTGDAVLQDFVDVLTQFPPDEVFSTLGPSTETYDTHGDHEATGRFLLDALAITRTMGVTPATRAYFTIVWGDGDGYWPCVDPLAADECGVTPVTPYTSPQIVTAAEWTAALHFPVPAAMRTPDHELNLKSLALAAYESQGGTNVWMRAHVRPTEFFWELDYCAGGACGAPLPDGSVCQLPGQCASGRCVDGHCCDAACDGQCQACDVAGHLGTCTAVSGAPHGTRAACATDGSACGGTCDPATPAACTYPGASTACRAASCTGGTATLAAACAGTGTCPAAQTQSCTPYVCGATACASACTGDAGCVSGDYCTPGGTCTPRLANGLACTAAGQCASGNCVDGRCCNAACAGQCQACDVAGHLGACTPVAGAPHGARAACATDGSACGGACDGSSTAACAYPGASTACRAPSCTGEIATLAAWCGGTGACPAAQIQECTPYVCGATACLTSCASDGDCIDGKYCAAGGICRDQRANGATCGASNQCTSGNCIDGRCCNSACAGQCQACDVAGHLGACTPVVGAPHGARAACATDGSACGGACDGSSTAACAYPGASTACRAASCAAGVATLAASCNGAGACPAVQTQECSPYLCGPTACLGDCAGDPDCTGGRFCAGGVCTLRRENGVACSAPNQCASGACVDGYCCETACDGQCQACDVADHLGACTPVIGAPHGARAACATDGSACGGACDGSSTAACAYPGASTACRAASCTAGVATLPASCTGAGACPALQTQPCSPYVCGATACLGDCQRDEDCTGARFCSGGVCTAKRENGATCSAPNECASGACADGYCCDDACGGQCQACDVAEHLGTCTPVIGDPHGARDACGENEAGCAGTCDGASAAACTYPATCGQEPGGGGGGCSTGGAAGGWALALGALAIAGLRRRPRARASAHTASMVERIPTPARASPEAVEGRAGRSSRGAAAGPGQGARSP